MMPLASATGRALQVVAIDNAVEAWHKSFHPPARLELRDDGAVMAMVRWDAREVPVGVTLDGAWRFEASGWWYWHTSKTIPTLVRSVTSEPADVARFSPSGILGWLNFPDVGRLVLPGGMTFDWSYPTGWSCGGIELVRFPFGADGSMSCTVDHGTIDEPALSVLVTLGMYLKYRGLTNV